jgi:DNA-binding transcriptional ArsR family regulator
MELSHAIEAIASGRRREILEWLKDPRANFPPQVYGDLVKDGVCSLFIARKMKVSPPTASVHLKILARAGLVKARRIKQWTFYKRDEKAIKAIKKAILASI